MRFVAQVVDAGAVYAGVVGAQCGAQGVVVMQEGQAGQLGVLGDEAVFEGVHGVSGRGNGGPLYGSSSAAGVSSPVRSTAARCIRHREA